MKRRYFFTQLFAVASSLGLFSIASRRPFTKEYRIYGYNSEKCFYNKRVEWEKSDHFKSLNQSMMSSRQILKHSFRWAEEEKAIVSRYTFNSYSSFLIWKHRVNSSNLVNKNKLGKLGLGIQQRILPPHV